MMTPHHLLLGLMLGLVFMNLGLIKALGQFLAFVLGSVVIDIDHFLTVMVRRGEPYSRLRSMLKSGRLREFLSFMKKQHKTLTKLLLHNYVIYLILFAACVLVRSSIAEMLLLGIIVHCFVDQVEDVLTLGHLRNWLWPFRPRSSSSYAWVLGASTLILILSFLTVFRAIGWSFY